MKRIEFEGKTHEFPNDFSDAEIQSALMGPAQGPTAFEQSNPDVQASRRAERLAHIAGWGETIARGTRDASALTLATLATRRMGGTLLPQALARIGTSAGIGAAEAPGGIPEKLAGAGWNAAATSGAEAVAPGMGLLKGPLRWLRGIAPPAPTPNVGAGIATGLKAADFVPKPLLYGSQGETVRSTVPALENIEAATPRLNSILQRIKGFSAKPPQPSPLATGLQIAGDTAATEQPQYTVAGLAGLLQMLGLGGSQNPARSTIGGGMP